MKSNVCRIENGTRDLAAILKESERVAEYNGLTHKQSLQLRLLCEELDGMLPEIIDEFDGELWIEFENGVCRINASIEFSEFTVEKKKNLIAVAKNKKNAAAAGVVGKIRSAVENFFLDGETPPVYTVSSAGYGRVANYTCIWSLVDYIGSVKKEERGESWDELEKSVIASVADDVIVGVKGKRADIIIVKKFV